MYDLKRKTEFFEVDDAVVDLYSVGTEHFGLHIGASESKSFRYRAEPVHDAITRYSVGIGIAVQCIPDHSGRMRLAECLRYIAVSRNFAPRHFFNELLHVVEKRHKNFLLFTLIIVAKK